MIINRTPTDRTDICAYVNDNVPFGWEEFFRIVEDEIEHAEEMIEELTDGIFQPPLNIMMRPFDLCPPEDLRVVILGNTPGPHTDGLAFSSSKGCNETTNNIFTKLSIEIPGFVTTTGSLTFMAVQGVLLLNTTLTRTVMDETSHTGIWDGFIARLCKYISGINNKCIFVIMGSIAQEATKRLNKCHPRIECSFPSNAQMKRSCKKDTDSFVQTEVFTMIDSIMAEQGMEPINWKLKI